MTKNTPYKSNVLQYALAILLWICSDDYLWICSDDYEVNSMKKIT